MTARCLSSLEELDREGFTPEAQRRLAGDERPFPHEVAFPRRQLLVYRAQVADRMSVSGVQEKVSLRLVDGKLEPTDIDGEYILKPAPVAELPKLTDDVPANEHVTMLLAERLFGIETPPNGLVRLADGSLAYVVKRFDRQGAERLPQEDFSQLMGRTPDVHGKGFKYDSSYEAIAQALRRLSPDSPLELERLFTRVVFCYAVSNGDAHLKNFSLLRRDPRGPHALSPAYDLLCTSLHIPNESRLALALFEDDFSTVSFQSHGFETGACFQELARRMDIAATRGRELLQPFLEDVTRARLEDLVGRSFLSDEAKQDYISRYRGRMKALAIDLDR